MGMLDVMDRAPAPTAAPQAGLVAMRMDRLFGRQLGIETCGYINGDAASAVYCNLDYECVQNTLNNVRGCCLPPIDSCTLATACVNSADLTASCDAECELNNFIMKCSNALSPLCFTRQWVTPELDSTQLEWGCSDDGAVQQTVYTSFSGEQTFSAPGGSVYSHSYTSASAAVSAVIGGASATGSSPASSSAPTSPASTSRGVDHDTVSDNGGGGGGGLSQGATIAIAVCATVVGLAIIGLLGFLCVWRKRKSAKSAATAAAAGRPGPPPMQPYPGPYGYAPPPEQPPFDYGPPGGAQAAYYSPSAVGAMGAPKDDGQWSAVDDDKLARMRRFSNDGTFATLDQTVAGRTNDDFRPQGA